MIRIYTMIAAMLLTGCASGLDFRTHPNGRASAQTSGGVVQCIGGSLYTIQYGMGTRYQGVNLIPHIGPGGMPKSCNPLQQQQVYR